MAPEHPLEEVVRHLEAKAEEVAVVQRREDRLAVDLVVIHLFVSTYLEMEEGNQVIEQEGETRADLAEMMAAEAYAEKSNIYNVDQ